MIFTYLIPTVLHILINISDDNIIFLKMSKRNNSVPQEDGPVLKHFKVDKMEVDTLHPIRCKKLSTAH